MTVRELISVLETCPQEAIVIMSSDSEGNGYSELFEIADDNNTWDAENEETGIGELNAGLIERGFREEDIVEGQPAIVLYPMN